MTLDHVLLAVSNQRRWQIFIELAKGEPLPVSELARRLGIGQSAMSKQIGVLRDCGVVVSRYGNYALRPGLLSADGKTLDFGWVVLRLDRY
ncbi:ArsR/SmtB family transcription factor [Haloferula sargassicola]|uniref:HTH arsR-type domain-containing protein n=1 Tax=Haloferula sargassicola TaxID=490096 RepID=A0ABP9UKZ6_9BACT